MAKENKKFSFIRIQEELRHFLKKMSGGEFK